MRSWTPGSASARRLGRHRGAQVGLAILGPLRRLDEIAYLRFASVYQGFESLEDFEQAIALLRAERDIDPDPSAAIDAEAVAGAGGVGTGPPGREQGAAASAAG